MRKIQTLFKTTFYCACRKWGLAIASVPAILLGTLIGLGDTEEVPTFGQTLGISEVCPHNFSLAADCNNNYSDYIELCNEGEETINLSGYYLSDNHKKPAKFKLPDKELAAGDCIIVWADGIGEACECRNEIHANFRLSDGETVVLTTKIGETVDSIELIDLMDNVSATKLGSVFVKAYGTPGIKNDGCKLYQAATLDMPVFSLESGFYPSESITLEFTVPEGETVYYTTDGSIPDANSAVYTEALVLTDVSETPNRYVNIKNTIPSYNAHKVNNAPVNKANVIRAISMDQQGNFSKIKTATYFVGETAKKIRRICSVIHCV